ncbi:MAG: hypothetical protein A3B07_00080 [Candidatus Yonathbacteria bacterium RIFCSPLOWO2_01_FULL_43_27]|uniref:Uncharacterized protein n=2 Tax=Parcubacteria group TaxID=1794811 RepID=A0A1G2SDL5_9BACT|nr:MAG: hypothetical protein UW78_C0004G0007 [Candidatus Azambacteria bacterium GW2011_GWA1_44_9]OHA79219.1 MAG: hypothetical protein A2658_02630 [Candidatus Yonathbacteria bacterium RIFCSPHIGHO2_01_FULL_44_19]OHA83157.1 MAG: hypothetical protein A3B07_00080 [Candidatus Yonathbacteria bacterium RIFCSPLOWO2_01_FULL_43_27]
MSRNYIILAFLVLGNIAIGVLCTMKYLEYREYQALHNTIKVVKPLTSPLPPLSPEARAEVRVLSALRTAYQASSTPLATSTIISQQKALDVARKKAAQNKTTTISPKVQQQQLLDLDTLRVQAQTRLPVSN